MRLTALAGAATRRPRTTIALWLGLVVACSAAGAITGTRTTSFSEGGTGESARADALVRAAGLEDPAAERVLIAGGDAAAVSAAADDVTARFGALREVGEVQGPRDAPELSTNGGRTVLVVARLRGDPDDAADHVAPLERAVAEVRGAHPGTELRQAGAGTGENEFMALLDEDLGKAGMLSLPVTLIVLLLVFGSVLAALVPLLLGLTSVVAAMGAYGVVSQIAPDGGSTGALVLLIGLAVGVDYSLFYIRRERDERAAGRSADAAISIAAATAGRAIVVSGLTVMLSLAGLFVTGLSIFTSMAVGTIIVVAFAVLGSLTVLPATLTVLGDRIDRRRLPFTGRRREGRLWARVAAEVTSRPVPWLVTAVCILAALALPAIDLRTGQTELPGGLPVVEAQEAIERAFPGAPEDADLVVTGADLRGAQPRLEALGERARDVTGGAGPVRVNVARDGQAAVVAVPMPDRPPGEAARTVAALREQVAPQAASVAPGARALVTGMAAENSDFEDRLTSRTPIVIALVLGGAFVLLLAAFRSAALSASAIALNLLSLGATYGILAAVFQNEWAEGLLGFESGGVVTEWIPLFAFVILFGLSMDYTVLVLERMREARANGRSPRAAAAEGIAATGATVTGAALVMAAVFAVFATLRLVENKMLGVGLTAAILLDVTLVRGVALPAVVSLLGERGWRVPSWDHRRAVPAPTSSASDVR
jgi:RND superfamily putative drug exporter